MYARVFEGLCRVCLLHWSPTDVLTPLVQGDSLTDHGTAISTFADVTISPDDEFPLSICPKCLILLKQAILFKFTCERTQRQLEEIKSKSDKTDLKTDIVKYCLQKHLSAQMPLARRHREKRKKKKYREKRWSQDAATTEAKKEEKEGCREDFDYFELPVTNDDTSEEDDFKPNKSETEQQTMKKHFKLSLKNIKSKLNKVKYERRKRASSERPMCHVCNKTYSCLNGLKAHLKRHEGDRFICELCGRGFKAKKELEVHCVCTHGFPRRYSCAHCDYQAKFKRDLVVHLNKHSGNRPYKCWQCEKSFFSIQVYRQHQVLHADKQFKCDSCPKEFYTKSELGAHHNAVHVRRYLYRCNVPGCQTIYRNLSTVRRHMSGAHGVSRGLQGAVQRVAAHSLAALLTGARLRPGAAQALG